MDCRSATQVDMACTCCLTGYEPIVSTSASLLHAVRQMISRFCKSGVQFCAVLRKVKIHKFSPTSTETCSLNHGKLFVNPSSSKNAADICFDVLSKCALAIKQQMVKERICLCGELVEVMGLESGAMDLCSCYRRVFNRLRASLLHGSAGMPTGLGELFQWRGDIVSSWIPVSMRCPESLGVYTVVVIQ